MLRFLHTSDWQLGLKLAFVAGDKGARARDQRFRTVEAMAALAKERSVEAVVVAGDVFDDNAVGDGTLQRARDALTAFAPIPVLLLPGNHDAAAVPDGALQRLAPQEHGLGHVHLLLDSSPVRVGEAVFHPCPLLRRHTREDPTAGLPARGDGDGEGEGDREGIRIAIAHGSVERYSEGKEALNLIDVDAALAKGFDYLALGDWHGTVSLRPRAWYSGAPEATSFKGNDPGNALVVEIAAPGEEPVVEKVPVAQAPWKTHEADLEGEEDVEALERWLRDLPTKSLTLLDLRLRGALSVSERARLDALLDGAEGQLLYLRSHLDDLALKPSEDDFARLELEGFVGRTVKRLGSADTPEARQALLLLHRLIHQEGVG